MKIILLVSILVLNSCNMETPLGKSIEFKIGIISKLNSNIFRGLTGDYYSVKIDLVNHTDSTLKFWIMTCYWQLNFISNSDELYLYNNGCDNNYPHIIEIEKNKSYSFDGVIRVSKELKLKKNRYKLGFIYIKEKEIKDELDFMSKVTNKKPDDKSIIWSNSFRIK